MNVSERSFRRKSKKATRTKGMQERWHQTDDNCLGKTNTDDTRTTGFLEQRSQQPRCPPRKGGAGGARGWAGSSQPQRQKQGGVGSGRGLRAGKMIQDVCLIQTSPTPPLPLPAPGTQATALPTQTHSGSKENSHKLEHSYSLLEGVFPTGLEPRSLHLQASFFTFKAIREE